jgi:hypothetical protein
LTSLGIVAATRLLATHWRRWPTYAVAVPPLALSLVTFFAYLDSVLAA